MTYGISVLSATLSFLIIVIFIIALNYMGEYIPFLNQRGLLLCTYMNPLVLLLAVSLFDIFSKRSFYNKHINRFAGLSLIIYLIHSNYFWITYGKYECYSRMIESGLQMTCAVFVLLGIYTATVVTLAVLYRDTIGALTKILSEKISKWLVSCTG